MQRSLLSHSSLVMTGVLALLSSVSSTAQAPTPASKVIYIHAGTLLDRPDAAPRGNSTLIVRDGKIEAIRDGFVAPEGGAKLVDLSKQFVLPGLIDMHVHIFNDDNKMRARIEQNNRDVEDNFVIGIDNARRTPHARSRLHDVARSRLGRPQRHSAARWHQQRLAGRTDALRRRTQYLHHQRPRRLIQQHQS